jgi:hypothetical protein
LKLKVSGKSELADNFGHFTRNVTKPLTRIVSGGSNGYCKTSKNPENRSFPARSGYGTSLAKA